MVRGGVWQGFFGPSPWRLHEGELTVERVSAELLEAYLESKKYCLMSNENPSEDLTGYDGFGIVVRYRENEYKELLMELGEDLENYAEREV